MASTSSPSMLSKLLLKKGSDPYKDLEISRTTTPETPPQPSFSAAPAEYSLLDVRFLIYMISAVRAISYTCTCT